jgi:hypothetical protein
MAIEMTTLAAMQFPKIALSRGTGTLPKCRLRRSISTPGEKPGLAVSGAAHCRADTPYQLRDTDGTPITPA